MNKIFCRVFHICESRNMTIYGLEVGIGVNHGTIQKWKYNEDLMPSSTILLQIADYLNVSIDYLLGRCNNPISHVDTPSLEKVAIQIFKEYKQLELNMEGARQRIQVTFKDSNIDTNLFLNNGNNDTQLKEDES